MVNALYGIEYKISDYLIENSDQPLTAIKPSASRFLGSGSYQQGDVYDEDFMRYIFSSFYLPQSFVAICAQDSLTQADLATMRGYNLCLFLAQEIIANKPGVNTLATQLVLSDPNPLVLIKKMLIALRDRYQ